VAQLHYAEDGQLSYPRHDDRAPEGELRRYLEQAVPGSKRVPPAGDPTVGEPAVGEPAVGEPMTGPTGLSAGLEELRWFDLAAGLPGRGRPGSLTVRPAEANAGRRADRGRWHASSERQSASRSVAR